MIRLAWWRGFGRGRGELLEDFWYSPPRVLGREGMENFWLRILVDGGCEEVDVDFWWSYGLMNCEEAIKGGQTSRVVSR